MLFPLHIRIWHISGTDGKHSTAKKEFPRVSELNSELSLDYSFEDYSLKIFLCRYCKPRNFCQFATRKLQSKTTFFILPWLLLSWQLFPGRCSLACSPGSISRGTVAGRCFLGSCSPTQLFSDSAVVGRCSLACSPGSISLGNGCR